jgi:hypothetical protein
MLVTASCRIPDRILGVDDFGHEDGEILDIMAGEVRTKQKVVNDTTAKVFNCETCQTESARANTPAALGATAEVPLCKCYSSLRRFGLCTACCGGHQKASA